MRERISKLKWVFAAVGISLLATVVLASCGKNKSIPDNMVGRWETATPRYKNRFLEISKVSIIFATGEETVDVNFVKRVEKRDEKGDAYYIIHYENREGESGNLALYWDPSVDGALRLKNQKGMVWKKTVEML